MAARPRPPYRPATQEIDEETDVGAVYMSGLLRSQLRPGLVVLGLLVLVLGGLPALFVAAPALTTVRVGVVPLPWLLLGIGVYPLMLALAWWHVRSAERTERAFTDILHPPPSRR